MEDTTPLSTEEETTQMNSEPECPPEELEYTETPESTEAAPEAENSAEPQETPEDCAPAEPEQAPEEPPSPHVEEPGVPEPSTQEDSSQTSEPEAPSSFAPETGSTAGIEIWRIENMDVAAVPPESYGKFYAGDSYIVLQTVQLRGTRLSWNIFYWLGAESSTDERGTAALKTIELGEQLPSAVHHREVMGHESESFLSLFRDGIEVLEGGIDSGFRHVVRDEYPVRLLHLKGRRNVRARQVTLSKSSLNHGDVFVLDAGLTIWQWNGCESSRMERAKGLDVVSKIRSDERAGRAAVIVLDDGQNDTPAHSDATAFWEHLGEGTVQSSAEGGDDAEFERQDCAASLYRVCDASGTLEVTRVEGAPLRKEMLDHDDCFILDAETEIFVWVGKGATKQERAESMRNAVDFLKQAGRPEWTPITRCFEGAEPPMFRDKFGSWPVPQRKPVAQPKKRREQTQEPIDVQALHHSKELRPEEKPLDMDPGTLQLTIWRIENFEKVEVPHELHGIFYTGDSYIVLAVYEFNRREKSIIYFWQGRQSTADERGSSAFLAAHLTEQLRSLPIQVRVVQNSEPAYFLSLFQGRMVVRSGGVPAGWHNVCETQSAEQLEEHALFHIRGTSALNTRAVQVPTTSASLNSGDAFILQRRERQYVWLGRGANAEERSFATSIAETLQADRESVVLEEGTEPEEFWELIGDHEDYPSEGVLGEEPPEPRLFQCTNATGAFKVHEIFNFCQDDLIQDDVMLLDAHTQVFVWVGKGSNDEEKRLSMEVALDYIKNAPDGRDPNTPALRIDQGEEPSMFTCHFIGWDPKKAMEFVDPYEARLQRLRDSQPKSAAPVYSLPDKKTSPPAEPAGDSTPTETQTTSTAQATESEVPKRAFVDPYEARRKRLAEQREQEKSAMAGNAFAEARRAFVDPYEARKQRLEEQCAQEKSALASAASGAKSTFVDPYELRQQRLREEREKERAKFDNEPHAIVSKGRRQ